MKTIALTVPFEELSQIRHRPEQLERVLLRLQRHFPNSQQRLQAGRALGCRSRHSEGETPVVRLKALLKAPCEE